MMKRNFHSLGPWLTTVIACALIASSSGVAAQSACSLSPSLDKLLAELGQLSSYKNISIDGRTTARIAKLGRRVNLQHVQAQLDGLDRTELIRPIKRILQISRDLRLPSHLNSVAVDLSVVLLGARSACSKQVPINSRQSDPSSALTEIGNPKTTKTELLGPSGNYGGLYILPGILVGAVGSLILGQYIYLWSFAKRFNRRSCQISVTLRIGDVDYDGTISILGHRGCLFRPKSSQAIEAAKKNLMLPGSYIATNDLILPSILQRVDSNGIGMLFEVQNTERSHLELLKSSTKEPKILKSVPPAANLKVRKVEYPTHSYRKSSALVT